MGFMPPMPNGPIMPIGPLPKPAPPIPPAQPNEPCPVPPPSALVSQNFPAELERVILRALDRVDSMKSAAPMLGQPRELDYGAARSCRIDDEPQSVEMKMELLRKFRGRFDLDKDHVYGLFTRDERDERDGRGNHGAGGRDGGAEEITVVWYLILSN